MIQSEIKYHCTECNKGWLATECDTKEIEANSVTGFVWFAYYCPVCHKAITAPTSEWVGIDE